MNKYLKALFLLLLSLMMGLIVWRGLHPWQEHVKICPVNAINMVQGKAVIDNAKCIGCRRCVDGIKLSSSELDFPKTKVPVSDSLAEPLVKSGSIQPEPAIAKTPEQKKPKIAEYIVNPDKCIGCQLCVAACPVGAISMKDEKAYIDKEKCINCGICKKGNQIDYQGCPVQAISGP